MEVRLRGLKASLGYLENSGQLGLHCNMKTQNQNKKAERASVSHCEEEACAEGRTGGSPAAQAHMLAVGQPLAVGPPRLSC